jgi:uncharacterized membrane protein YfcA
MIVAFARYSRSQSFAVLRRNSGFVIAMTAGSIAGTVLGSFLLGVVSDAVLIPLLGLLLVLPAIKVWSHR